MLELHKELEAFFADHTGHDDPVWREFLDNEARLIQSKHDELREEHSNLGRFGMAKAGGPTRAAALKYLGYEEEPLSGSTRVTFHIGHLLECMALAALQTMGYELGNLNDEYIHIEPMMTSKPDAILTIDGVPRPLSIKTNGYKMSGQSKGKWRRYGFAQLPIDGLYTTNAGWYAQLQVEMEAIGAGEGIILVVAKDVVKKFEEDPYMQENGSLTFYSEVIPYDSGFVHELLEPWREVWGSVQQGVVPSECLILSDASGQLEPLPKPAVLSPDANKDGRWNFNHCRYCAMQPACKQEYGNAFRRKRGLPVKGINTTDAAAD